jgi:type IV secretion system protein TrbI
LSPIANLLRPYLERTSDNQITSGARLVGPASPYTLMTGSVVPAALITGLRSDIPGQVLAQVTQDVRDSLTGQYILIPKGARLIGQYDNAISFGQSRILLVWSRLILPNGKSLVLDKLSAADARGYAGLADTVDNHWALIVNAAATSTLLGMGAQTGDTQSESDLVRALRDGAADSVNRAGQRIVERQLAVQPTLTIRAGMPLRVILSRDLILEPYGD